MPDRRPVAASPDPGPPNLTSERLALMAAIAAGEVRQHKRADAAPYVEHRPADRAQPARRVTGEVRWLRSHGLARLGEEIGSTRPILLTPKGRELLP